MMNMKNPKEYDELLRWLTDKTKQLKNHEYNSVIITILTVLAIIVCSLLTVLFAIFIFVIGLAKSAWQKLSVVFSSDISKKNNNHTCGIAINTCLFIVALSLLLYYGVRGIHQRAKFTNQQVSKYRDVTRNSAFSFYNIPRLEDYCNYLTDDLVDENFKNIFNAMFNNRRNSDIYDISQRLSFPPEKCNKLYFKKISDYFIFLHSVGFNEDAYQGEMLLLQKGDSLLECVLNKYTKAAIDEFSLGRFYSSNEYVDRFFNIYKNKTTFPLSGENNSIHILRLLLEYRQVLWTNREFAELALECVEDDDYSRRLGFYGDNQDLKLINGYFEGVNLFQRSCFLDAQEKFSQLFDETQDSSLIAQYCMHMAIRSACWNYYTNWTNGKQKEEAAYNNFCEVYNRFASSITLPYFVSDVIEYRNDVEEIHCPKL